MVEVFRARSGPDWGLTTASTAFRGLSHGLLVEADEPLHPVDVLWKLRR